VRKLAALREIPIGYHQDLTREQRKASFGQDQKKSNQQDRQSFGKKYAKDSKFHNKHNALAPLSC
jgi:hypothetical protein